MLLFFNFVDRLIFYEARSFGSRLCFLLQIRKSPCMLDPLDKSVLSHWARKMKRWMQRQHLSLWRSPCGTQRQARELISGPNLATGARLLSFNRTQFRVVIGLPTGHNTLRRHLHVMGLSNNPTCRKCGIEEETSVHILGECEVLASLRHLGFFLFGPRGYQDARGGGHLELC